MHIIEAAILKTRKFLENVGIEKYILRTCLRWLVGLNLIQLEQQKTQLPLIVLAKNLKLILCRVLKGT